jgi:glycosyltransferase involved in cell wall biosynthesis
VPALPGARRLVLAVGRIAPVKNYELLIAAAQRVTAAHADVDFVVAGGAHAPGMQAYLGQLQALAAASALGSRFQFVGPLPYAALPGLYQSAAVAANLCGTGGMDKAVLEGFSCGLPTVVRNTTFAGLLAEDAPALLASDATADDVALLLLGVLQQPAAARQALGARLRSRVVAGYGEQALAEKLFASLKELCA